MARPPPCPQGKGSWVLAGGDATGRAGAQETLHPVPEHSKEQGVLFTPYTHLRQLGAVWDWGQWQNAPVWPPVVFLSLVDIWHIAASSQKEALMEDVGVGRKELTLLLKSNMNGIVSDCFQQTSPGRKSPCAALLRQALVGSFGLLIACFVPCWRCWFVLAPLAV